MATEEVVVPVVPVEAPVIEEKGDVSKVKKAKKVTKSKPKSPALHPPYFEMIKEAIVSLKERTGSSQYAITKFVEENQKNLPANFKKVLLTQLKKLVAGGKLVKVKASYKLPSAAAPAKAKKKVAAKPKTVAKKPKAAPKAKAVAKPKAVAKAKPAAKAKPVAKPNAAAVKSKAKPKTPTKPAKVAKKAPVAKAIAAKKTPVKKASVKSLKPKAGIAKKVSAG
ncbi:histone H1-like protein, partial [Tanacetum coccineum]